MWSSPTMSCSSKQMWSRPTGGPRFYQVAQIQNQRWTNKVGTYGVANAQPSLPPWGFVFVDDFCWILRQSQARRHTILLQGSFLASPLSWKKIRLALINFWVGFPIDPAGPIVTMGPEKHEVVMALEAFASKEIERALGRISWATTICPMTR